MPAVEIARVRPEADADIEMERLQWEPSALTEWSLEVEVEGTRFSYEAALRSHAGTARAELERVSILGDDGATVVAERDRVGARAAQTADGETRFIPLSPPADRSLLGWVADPVAYPELAQLFRALRGWHYVHPNPTLMRLTPREPANGDRLDRFGRDLNALVARLLVEQRRQVGLWLEATKVFSGWADVGAAARRGGRADVWVQEPGRDAKIPLALASDGQLAVAWVAAVVLGLPDEVTLLLVDEPAGAIAHGEAHRLEEPLSVLATRVQVVAATQALGTLDYTPSRGDVWLTERGWGSPTRLTPLSERAADIPGGVPPGQAAEEAWSEPLDLEE